MKRMGRGWMGMLGVAALVVVAAQSAMAQCGMPAKAVKPASWHPQFGAHLRLASDDGPFHADGKSIVGMWHVIFTGDTSMGAPAGPIPVDNALVVWNADGTEVMNSFRPPQDGNFCMGVWEQTGKDQYYLNHFAWYANQYPNNTDNGIGPAVGPTHIREWVTLSPDGNHFTGHFQLDAYDLSNKIYASFTGPLTGTRVTISTTEQDLVGN